VLIGAIADETGVNIETIRYYERVGLLPAPPRSGGRQRLYDEGHVRRLTFIRRGRELGFPLDDIRMLLQLVDAGRLDFSATKQMTLRHLADLRGKIASLRKLERALATMTSACQPGRQSTCPILDALSGKT
jgi:MerR family mercuric resistance operon transcriptional regulator